MLKFFIIGLLFAMSTTASAQTLHDFTMKDIDGNDVNLSDYSGQVVMIVNVASFCGYTRQYEPLEKIYEQYKDRGFVILGFPANDYGAQEPGTEEEIKEFCSNTYHVTFPMFSKVTVKGDEKHELFGWLTGGAGNAELSGEIAWNFEKFLINKQGALVKRYGTRVEPDDAAVTTEIEALLGS